jgi:predicted peroxiredoxin
LQELIDIAAELGVKLNVYEMSMGLLGLQRDELIDYPGLGSCGVAAFVEQAAKQGLVVSVRRSHVPCR